MRNKYEKIIAGLQRYHYLTYKQMIEIGIATHTSNLSPHARDLMKDEYIYMWEESDRTVVCYLSKKGARRFGGVGRKKMEKRPSEFTHRLRIVDVEIMLSKHNLVSCSKDNDAGKPTAIPLLNRNFEPDLIGIIQTPRQEELYLVEVELGIDKQKVLNKIELHLSALRNGAVASKINWRVGYRILIVTQNQGMIERTIKSVKEDALQYAENFLFSSDLKSWVNMRGQPRKLYYT